MTDPMGTPGATWWSTDRPDLAPRLGAPTGDVPHQNRAKHPVVQSVYLRVDPPDGGVL